jgi:hypothetical protein
MRTVLVAVALSTLTAVSLVAQKAPPPAKNPLAAVQAVRCTFRSFVTTEWKNGAPVSVTSPQNFSFDIDSINLKKKTARIVSGQASAVANAFLTDTGLNIIEQTQLGNFLLTSIFVAGGTGTTFPAAHSRHLGDLDSPPSIYQHYGSCDVVK